MRPSDVVKALSEFLWQAGDHKRRSDSFIAHGGGDKQREAAETEENVKELKQEMLTALETLEKICVLLPADRVGTVYIAGPMTGLPEYNFPAFNEAAEALRAQGETVYNPADHGLVEGALWDDYLRFDIGNLVKCESIYLLPGWSNSKGARTELKLAKKLDIVVRFAPGAEQPLD